MEAGRCLRVPGTLSQVFPAPNPFQASLLLRADSGNLPLELQRNEVVEGLGTRGGGDEPRGLSAPSSTHRESWKGPS